LHSYSAKYLVVDLTNRKTEERELPERLSRGFLGGAGLGTRLLLEWSKSGADALSPDNPIVFACGGLAGTMAPASACHAVVTKSPLTGFLSSSVSSGLWSLGLKRTGFDAMVVMGAASSPVYLFIDDSQVHFRNAESLSGKGCLQTEAAIRHRTGDGRVQVASIGPAKTRRPQASAAAWQSCLFWMPPPTAWMTSSFLPVHSSIRPMTRR
jgi:aldehyde:ferredoxin oxidoreductase